MFVHRPGDGVSAWNRTFRVSGFKGAPACGEGRMAGVAIDTIGIDLTAQR